MTRALSALGLAGLGAGLMYLIDPNSGRRRRTMVRDKALHGLKEVRHEVAIGAKDLSHRAKGRVAEARHIADHAVPPNNILLARIRSHIGRSVVHSHALKIDVDRGHVTLSGPVLAEEARQLLEVIPKVHGVRSVEDRLAIYCNTEHIPSLQGEGTLRSRLQGQWRPGTRLLCAALGGTGLVLSAARRGKLATAGGVASGLLLLRAVTNRSLPSLFGLNRRRYLLDFQKNIYIAAPIERVFDYWDSFEHFPEFMSHVKAISNLGRGRSRWTVVGPAGLPVSWDALITERRPNAVLAWKSVDGSAVGNAGIVQFEQMEEGTRLNIRLTYNPPGGALGHAVAWLFRKDPHHALNEDLLRLKSLLEVGKTSLRHEAVIEPGAVSGQQPTIPTVH